MSGNFFYDGKVRFPEQARTLMVPLDSIEQFPGNPNNGDLDKLVESIRVNGFTTVITVDAATRQIVAGNHRWQALHALGATHIPALFVEYDKTTDAKRFLVGDNKTGQLAVVEESGLLAFLEEIVAEEGNLFGTGYEDSDLIDLRALTDEQIAPNEDGFGHGPAILGIYEVTISFDDPDDREAFASEMRGRFEDDNIREANL